MSEDKSSHLVGVLKILIKDHGMPKSVNDISDADFRSLATTHMDEFDEALGACESDLTLV